MSALHWAAERGDAEMADDAGPCRRQARRGHAHRPVHAAAPGQPCGQRRGRRALLDAGAAVDARTAVSGVTPLHLAAAAGNPEVVSAAHRRQGRRERAEVGMGPDAADLRRLAQPGRGGEGAARARRRSRRHQRRPSTSTKHMPLDRRPSNQRREGARDVPPARTASPRRASCRRPCRPAASSTRRARCRSPRSRRPTRAAAATPRRRATRRCAQDQGGQGQQQFYDETPGLSSKGGLTALLHAARQGYLESARALLDGGARDQRGQRRRRAPARCSWRPSTASSTWRCCCSSAAPTRTWRRQDERRHAAVARSTPSGSRAPGSRSPRRWSCRRPPTWT